MRLKLWILSLFLLFFSGYVGAATFHAIIVADTLDREIGAAKDRDKIRQMVETVSQATGLTPKLTVLEDSTIAPHGDGYQKVSSTVEQLQLASDDVVLFYYIGHGKNTNQSGGLGGDRWPALAVQGISTLSDDDKLVKLSWVGQTIRNKNPRLSIVLADTGNEIDPDVDRGAITSLPSTGAYKALFLENRGFIIASATIPGQKAWGNSEIGGYFTEGFLASLRTELQSANPNWETVMANTKTSVQKAHPDQTPQAEVKVTRSVSNDGTDNTDDNNTNDTDDEENTPVAIQKLTVDKFDSNSAKLRAEHQSKLRAWNQNLQSAKSLETPKVAVEGHADSQGSDEHNLDLSRQRAKSVKDYLVKQLGTDPNRLQVVPHGESRPIASNETTSGRALNRRVELISESSAKPVDEPKNALSEPEDSTPVTTDNTPTMPSSPIEPIRVCPENASIFGACYWGDDSDSDKKWSVFVEEKAWLSTWTGWESGQPSNSKVDGQDNYLEVKGGNHLLSITSDPEIASILTLGFRYDKLSIGLSFLPKQSYNFPEFARSIVWWRTKSDNTGEEYKISEEKVTTSAEREEIDVTVGYSILPQLHVGLGFKRVMLDYEYSHTSKNPFDNPNPINSSWSSEEEYKTYGVSLNIGGQVCLANWLYSNVSMFGNFSYGAMKTRGPEGDSDPSVYHSTNLGLSFELPKLKRFKSEIRFGYRAQTIYTEIPVSDIKSDAVDTTEGFTLALRVTY